MCGFIAQLVEHRTGIAEVTGSNPVEALISFRLLLSNCLNWKIYCDDHSSLLGCHSLCIELMLRINLEKEDGKIPFSDIKSPMLTILCTARCFISTRLNLLFNIVWFTTSS